MPGASRGSWSKAACAHRIRSGTSGVSAPRWLAGCVVPQAELLRRLAQILERLGIPYLITGSVATIYWGEPRLTRDIDVVVELGLPEARRLVREFPPPEFYVSDEAAEEAVR